MHLTIDCARSLGPLRHFWQSTGFTPASLLLDADMRQAIAIIGAVPHGGITWVRIHYLLELVTAIDLGTSHPSYNWSRLDVALDVLVRSGLKPIFELMGNVAGYFTDYTVTAQALAWRDLVHALAEHLIDRYGEAQVRSWLFETWNEPDVRFWTQGDEAFCIYYDACAAGLQTVDPALRLGGPGTCRNLSPTLKTFLAHCDTGINALTGGPATRPAFISVHEKGVRSHLEDLTPDSMGITEREARIVDYIREHHPALAGLPFMNNECDPQVGWGTIHTWRARPYYAALVVKIINQHLLTLVDGKGVDYSLLSNDNGFLGTWGHRTLLTRFSETDHIDHGQADGQRDGPRLEEDLLRRSFELIKKPVLNVMTLLSLLGDERYAVTGTGGAAAPCGAIATHRGEEQVAALLYNSVDAINAGGNSPVTLTLMNLPFRRAMLCTFQIPAPSEAAGMDTDPFAVWDRMGAPDRPTPEQFARMRHHQELMMVDSPREVEIPNDTLSLNLTMDLPSVVLVLLTVDPGTPPERVVDVRAERYEGLDGHAKVLLTWTGTGSRTLRTYEILAARTIDGPVERINVVDQLDTAFLHSLDPAYRVYWVRAIDFWNRGSDLSDPVHITD